LAKVIQLENEITQLRADVVDILARLKRMGS